MLILLCRLDFFQYRLNGPVSAKSETNRSNRNNGFKTVFRRPFKTQIHQAV
ncbi:hypothetical protein HMPREF3156_01175 [Neisseria sp. HMSC06F02]|nr:hypothetical protein HMPREF3156_01175 [Neisseria sp. HMSC06F02]